MYCALSYAALQGYSVVAECWPEWAVCDECTAYLQCIVCLVSQPLCVVYQVHCKLYSVVCRALFGTHTCSSALYSEALSSERDL